MKFESMPNVTSLYPNPVSYFLYMEDFEKVKEGSIADLSGKSDHCRDGQGEHAFLERINVKNLSDRMYLFENRSNERRIVCKAGRYDEAVSFRWKFQYKHLSRSSDICLCYTKSIGNDEDLRKHKLRINLFVFFRHSF